MSTDIFRDSNGKALVKNNMYRRSLDTSNDCYRCVRLDDPNGTMFLRVRDGNVFLGREFLMMGDDGFYYAVYDVTKEIPE